MRDGWVWGLVAVPVGGGRARAGLEIDHSERSSRVAISRAGRRPPARTAGRFGEAGLTALHSGPPPAGAPSSLNVQSKVMEPPPEWGGRLHWSTRRMA